MTRFLKFRFKKIVRWYQQGNLHTRDLDDNLLKWILLDWDVAWVPEFGDNETKQVTPTKEAICEWPLKSTKLKYDDAEDYKTTYIPLIVHEIWASIEKDFRADIKKFSCEVMKVYPEDNFSVLYCEDSFETTKKELKEDNFDDDSEWRGRGNVILISLPNKSKVFGYILDKRCEVEEKQGTEKVTVYLGYLIKIRKIEINVEESRLNCRSLHYIKPTIRHVKGIFSMKTWKLCDGILKPDINLCKVECQTLDIDHFNASQKKAISSSVHMVNSSENKIFLIQGPPGTGKTHTLIGIVKQIYLNWNKPNLPKIMICAPSNGAVDEIGRRLYQVREFLFEKTKSDLRMVRVGMDEKIGEDCREFSLKYYTENIYVDVQKKKEFKERERRLDLEAAFLRLSFEPDASKQKENELKKLREEFEKNCKKKKDEDVILKESNVIFATLNSCHSNLIKDAMKKKQFDCVIVDEAAQCCEPEILLPLYYGVTKLILIGDHKQLPATVLSKVGQNYNYGRSLFERFYEVFSQELSQEENPILMLNEQYRMHQDICKFPSENFYMGKLKTSQSVMERSFPLRPYTVFDLFDTCEDKNQNLSAFNVKEADFIVKLLKTLDDALGNNLNEVQSSKVPSSVGVITPYQGQKSLIEKKLKELNRDFKIRVDVNTVDGFQGQERDVIVLSLVRSIKPEERHQGIGFVRSPQRMNVALTRPKHKLIVCGSLSTLKMDAKWKRLFSNSKRRNVYCKIWSSFDETRLIDYF